MTGLEMISFVPTPGPQQMCLETPAFETLFGGAAGGGKLQSIACLSAIVYNDGMAPHPNDESKVCTPFGFKKLADIKVGDQISNPDGTVQRVIQVHEHGPQKMYRLTFIDGATCVAGAEHLWNAHLSGKRLKAERRMWNPETAFDGEKLRDIVMDTLTLERHLKAAQQAEAEGKRPNWPLIPLTKPVEFTVASRNASARWPVHPYLLGVLLGDGSITRTAYTLNSPVFWTKPDLQIVEEITALGLKVRTGPDGKTQYVERALEVNQGLEALGLLGTKSATKFIPDAYKVMPLEMRWALIQGLMDTDGTADERGHCSFTSVSEQLARDVQWLAWSLGFKATITDRIPTYTYKEEKREGQRAYMVYIAGDLTPELFRLKRKKERCKYGINGGDEAYRRLVKIEEIGVADARCITVDHPNSLYITDDFIVTHNSAVAVAIAAAEMHKMGSQTVIFRRNYPQLIGAGGLVQKAQTFYASARFRWRAGLLRFENEDTGATIDFKHLGRDADLENYQGQEFTRCVAEGTLIRMGDGSLKAVQEVRVGDMVMTLEGPRKVERTFPSRLAACVEATVTAPDGTITTQVHPEDHPVLMPFGWYSYADMRGASSPFETSVSTQSREGRKSVSRSGMQSGGPSKTRHNQSWGQQPPAEPIAPPQGYEDQSGTFSLSASQGNDSEASDDSRPSLLPPQGLSVPVVLYAPSLPSGQPACVPIYRGDDSEYGLAGLSVPDSLDGYRLLPRCDDARSLPPLGSALDVIPLQGDAEKQTLDCSRLDEPEGIPAHTHATNAYLHPYTKEVRPVCVDVCLGELSMRPVGERTVYDLQIEGANHYVSSPNLINKNCVFDELGQFDEQQYLYMFSRVRSPYPDIHARVLGTANPGGRGGPWIKKRWRAWLDPKYTSVFIWEGQEYHFGPAKHGEVRWYARLNDIDTEVPAGYPNATSRTFIGSRVTDNPYLMRDQSYISRLMNLPLLDRKRLLEGDWDIEADGNVFKRAWFKIIPNYQVPPNLRWVRGIDMASTGSTTSDECASALLAIAPDGRIFLKRSWAEHLDWPEQRKVIKAQILNPDEGGFTTRNGIEWAATGIPLVQELQRDPDLQGAIIMPISHGGIGKLSHAQVWSVRAEQGLFYLVEGDWNDAFIDQATSFTGDGNSLDDRVDAVSIAYRTASQAPPSSQDYT